MIDPTSQRKVKNEERAAHSISPHHKSHQQFQRCYPSDAFIPSIMRGRQRRHGCSLLLLLRCLLIACFFCLMLNIPLYWHLKRYNNHNFHQGIFGWLPPLFSVRLKALAEPPEQDWITERDRIVNVSTPEEEWRQDLIVGIPTVPRKGNPEYLIQAVESLLTIGNLNASQIYIWHTRSGNTTSSHQSGNEGQRRRHVVLESLLRKHGDLMLLQLLDVSPTTIMPMSTHYSLPNDASNRVVRAFADDFNRKQWRIAEAFDFLCLCKTLLRQQQYKYILFHQDDARLIDPLPSHLNLRLDGSNSYRHVLSLYSDHTPHRGRRFCFASGGMFCGMVSMMFRRQALQEFVDWLEPRYHLLPIDWSMEEFLALKKYNVATTASVQHMGSTSSLDQKQQQQESEDVQTRRIPDRIVHECHFDNSSFVSIGLVYTVPSNQRMEHLVLCLRELFCLLLEQFHILPPPASLLELWNELQQQHQQQQRQPPVHWQNEVNHAPVFTSPRQVLYALARPYRGYEPNPWTFIPPIERNALRWGRPLQNVVVSDNSSTDGVLQESSTFTKLQQFLHVVRHLLQTTTSPWLGYWHDDILPYQKVVDWKALLSAATTIDKSGGSGIVSFYVYNTTATTRESSTPFSLDDTSTWLECGDSSSSVRCGLEAALFLRQTLHEFVAYIEKTMLHSHTTNNELGVWLLQFVNDERNGASIPALPITQWVGQRRLDHLGTAKVGY